MRYTLFYIVLGALFFYSSCLDYDSLLQKNTIDAGPRVQIREKPDAPTLVKYMDAEPSTSNHNLPTFRVNTSRTGFHNTSDVQTKPKYLWGGKLNGNPPHSILFHNEKMYVTGKNGFSVYKYPSRIEHWSYSTTKSLSTPSLTRNSILFSNSWGELISFGLQSERENWRYKGKAPGIGAPVANHLNAFYTTYSKDRVSDFAYPYLDSLTLLSNRLTDGRLDWKVSISGSLSSSLCLTSNLIFLVVRNSHNGEGDLYSIQISSGAIVWKRHLKKIQFGFLSFSEGTLYLTTDETISAIKSETGELLWSLNIPNSSRSRTALVLDKLIYVSNKYLSVVDLKTREKLWTNRNFEVCGSPIVGKKQIYVNSCSGDILSFSLGTGKLLWSVQNIFPSDFYMSSCLSIISGEIFVSTQPNIFDVLR